MILGVDPGFNGALCLIDQLGGLYICDVPIIKKSNLTCRDREVDGFQIHRWLATYTSGAGLELAVIEKVHAMPGQGVSSMFRFGEGYGIIQGVVATLNPRLIRPPPAVWKAQMNLSKNKSDSLKLACGMTNASHHHWFKYAKNDGRAEALLLAFFGARSLGWDLSVFSKSLLGEKTNGLNDIL